MRKKKSDCMQSYFDRVEGMPQDALNVDSDSFVPCTQGGYKITLSAKDVSESHLTETKS